MNCDKTNKKALIGLGFFLIFFLIFGISQIYHIKHFIIFLILISFPIIGIYFILPYLNCLQKYNKH
jgi:TM2 domain-containing membrane protein YozV